MAKLLKLRRGTTSQHSSFTGAEGEVTVDMDKDVLVVHDGSTQGGHPIAAEDMANVSSAAIAGRLGTDSIAVGKIAAGTLPSDVKIVDANVSGNLTIESADIVNGTIVNDDINASAAIANSKLADSGVSAGSVGSSSAIPVITVNAKGIITGTSTTAIDSTTIANGTSNVAVANNGDITATRSGTARLVVDDAGVDVTGVITATQNASFTGGCSAASFTTNNGNLIINSQTPQISLVDSDGNPDYLIKVNGGIFDIRDNTADATRLSVQSDGHVDVAGNLDVGSGIDCTGTLDVTGNILLSGTVDGRDVAADGTKLDGIESSATADQTAAEIRTLVESASDSNVFTDADHSKLNGIEASATADQSAAEIRTLVDLATDSNVLTNTLKGKLDGIEAGATADQTGAEIASALGAQSIYTTGNIGRDANDHIAFTDNTRMDIYINNSNEFRFESDGDFHADGDVIAYSTTTASDENLKKDITTVTDAITKAEALKGVTFTWKKDDRKSAGVIAQDVEKVLPEAVRTISNFDGDEFKAVNYGAITSILIEAVKELSAKVKVLEAK